MLDKLRTISSAPGFKMAVGAFIVPVVAFCIWFNWVWLNDLWTPDPVKQSRVAISVGTPTVHTRERLLNDRFEQVAWLDEELRGTRPEKSKKPEATPSAPAPAPAPAAAKEAAEQRMQITSESLEQLRYGADDPRKDFEMVNGYRDVLRAARARAMLDDRHDMDDNTLDLFSFDTTVMPRNGMHGSAAIEVLLTPDASELDPGLPGYKLARELFDQQADKDLFDTYVGWLDKVRNVQQSSLETLTYTLDTLEASQYRSSDYEQLLRRNACGELLRRARPDTSIVERQRACLSTLTGTTPWDWWERSPKPMIADTDARDAMRLLDKTLTSVTSKVLTRIAGDFLEQVEHARKLFLAKNRQALSDPTAQFNETLVAYGKSSLRGAEDLASGCIGTSTDTAASGVSVVPFWIVDALKREFPGDAQDLVFTCKIVPKNMPLRVFWALLDKLGPNAPETAPQNGSSQARDWSVPVVGGITFSSRDLERVQTSCVAASILEETAVRPTADQPRNHGASLKTFFDIRVDRLPTGCSLSVQPKVFSLRLPADLSGDELADANTQLNQQTDLLHQLKKLLEGPGYGNGSVEKPITAAYGYSLSPRLRQNVEIRRDTRDVASARFEQGGGSFKRSRGLDYRGVEPEVVGFMRSSKSERTPRAARFGWLLTPRPGKEDTYSVPLEQAELSAVVALPSWWRSALMQTCTRFLAQADTGDVVTDEFWDRSAKCRVEMIRLPGTSADVSRHLGMDVLTTPYMNSWKKPPVLFAGKTAESTQLVITGERLWRNTVVTLGGQKADRIEVLPDMTGIAATFTCIRKPTTGDFFLNDTQPQGPTAGPAIMVDRPESAPNAQPKGQTTSKQPSQRNRKTVLSTIVQTVSGQPVDKPAVAAPPMPPPPLPLPSAPATPTPPPSSPATLMLPPPPPSATYTVPVTVWTSEGHTSSLDANVVVDLGQTIKPCEGDVGGEKSMP